MWTLEKFDEFSVWFSQMTIKIFILTMIFQFLSSKAYFCCFSTWKFGFALIFELLSLFRKISETSKRLLFKKGNQEKVFSLFIYTYIYMKWKDSSSPLFYSRYTEIAKCPTSQRGGKLEETTIRESEGEILKKSIVSLPPFSRRVKS